MTKFRVVEITEADYPHGDPDRNQYPEAKNDEFPHLAEYVEDEAALFVVAEDGRFWPASEFFLAVKCDGFEAEIEE